MAEPQHSNPNFKPGDVVMMKMGGPHMTVEQVTGTKPLICCVWFDARNRLHRDSFDDFSLKPVPA